MKKTAFVTGGTGFIGINLLKKLVAESWEVTALHRPTSDLTYLKNLDIHWVVGTLEDRASLELGMPNDLDAVFHVAGDVNLWKKRYNAQTETNVTGTRNMVEVAAAKKAKCFVHTSSISAWGDVRGLTTEDTPQRGALSSGNYEKTKWAGEQEALKGEKLGMKVVVMNPSVVLGPYDITTWGGAFIALQNDDSPFIPPGTSCFVHVDEVVKAHIAAVEKGRNGEKYILGGENVSFKVFMDEICRLLGKKTPPVASVFLFKLLGKVFDFVSVFTNKPPLITPELADEISRQDYRFSSEKAQRELGLQIVPLNVCVKDCYDWLKQEGFLK
jgi:dihydroflavonol-4-reductase